MTKNATIAPVSIIQPLRQILEEVHKRLAALQNDMHETKKQTEERRREIRSLTRRPAVLDSIRREGLRQYRLACDGNPTSDDNPPFRGMVGADCEAVNADLYKYAVEFKELNGITIQEYETGRFDGIERILNQRASAVVMRVECNRSPRTGRSLRTIVEAADASIRSARPEIVEPAASTNEME